MYYHLGILLWECDIQSYSLSGFHNLLSCWKQMFSPSCSGGYSQQDLYILEDLSCAHISNFVPSWSMNFSFICPGNTGSTDWSLQSWRSSCKGVLSHWLGYYATQLCPNLGCYYYPLPSGRSFWLGVSWDGCIMQSHIPLKTWQTQWAIVRDNFLWYPIPGENWLQVSDDHPAADGVHLCFFDVPAIVVHNH